MLPYINAPFEYVGSSLGTSADELKLVFSFYLSYPLAGVLKRIPDKAPWQKNVFIIAVAMFYLVGLFDLWAGLRTIVISAAGAYVIASRVDSPFMPWIGFIFLMGHMSMNHIIRQSVNDPSAVDISGAQMVLVMKLTAFCWNVQDGRLPEADLSEFQKEHAVRTMPSILDYAGYVLFFPGLMAGPAFDYCDYSQYITTTMFTLPPGVDPSKAPPTRKKRKIPRSGTPAAIKGIYGTLWIFAFLKFSSWYYPSFYLGDEYMQYGFLRRVWQLYMLGLTTRMKYYGVWSLSEGACILSGIGYNGIDLKTGRAKWDRLTNIHPIAIETAQNTRAFLGEWNINTNLWLRNYMFLRVTPKGQKPGFGATLATFVTSAFWHGFYPGYYMAFVLAALLQAAAKSGRRLVRPLFLGTDGKSALPTKIYYDVFTFFLTQAAFTFTVAPFILLGFSDTLKVWSRVYFYTLIGVAGSYGLFSRSLPFRKQLQQRQSVRTTPTSTTEMDISQIEQIAKEEIKKDNLTRIDTTTSTASSSRAPTLGIADDPEAELDSIVAQVKREIAERKRRGSTLQGFDVKTAIQEKIKEFKSS
ncbi:MBOAT, membrane-bound O-acyltransferase family-domain-containing protein [Boeremia exigua]|uniref:MBOAT, membrane-bound O-acyltransferase family-domain-containing protein n=1 Tax=Boeremia exigua TaxID=749465 RepID=UPI001E8CCC05|nr:MBOAT, membrane-bound O-acyltransferase family-domain-containing protein [Boeremia exigua]KAH6622041.1 MBOAT, membrane-bound O-acyltransferase family-domain-containing protein [Boeremia exigua]